MFNLKTCLYIIIYHSISFYTLKLVCQVTARVAMEWYYTTTSTTKIIQINNSMVSVYLVDSSFDLVISSMQSANERNTVYIL